jgi:outer membrane protein assembly factor BamB
VELDENASTVSVEASNDGATIARASATRPDHTVYTRETVVTEVVAADELLAVTTAAGDSYGVCPRTGAVRWSVPSTGSFTRPLIHGETVYLGGLGQMWEDGIEKDQERNQLFAVEGQSGNVVWRQRVDGRPSRGMTVVDDSLVVPAMIHGLHVLDRETGETVWSEPFDPEGVFSLVTDGGSIVYVGGWEAIHGFDLTDRERIWTHRTDGPAIAPRVIDDVLFMLTRSGITALDSENGSKRWSRETSRRPRVAVSRNSLIVNTVDSVECFRSNGERKWCWSDGMLSYVIPRTDSERVYVGTDDGSVHALDLETGRELWAARTTPEHPIRSGVAMDREDIFVGDSAGRIYSIDKRSGEIDWWVDLESA